MEEIKEDANNEQESSLDQNINDEPQESSPVDHVEPTTKEGGQEVPFHKHPRWLELQQEKELARKEAEYWREQAMSKPAPVVHHSPVQDERDPYEGIDAQTRVFYQELDKRNKKLVDQAIKEKENQFAQIFQTQQEAIASLQVKTFQQENKDINPGSAEESRIARLVRGGVSLEEATWAVMGPKRVKEAESKGNIKKTITKENKIKANLETDSMPANHGIPEKNSMSF